MDRKKIENDDVYSEQKESSQEAQAENEEKEIKERRAEIDEKQAKEPEPEIKTERADTSDGQTGKGPEIKETEIFNGSIEDGLKRFAEEAARGADAGPSEEQKEKVQKQKKKEKAVAAERKESEEEEIENGKKPWKKKVRKTLLLIAGSIFLIVVAVYAGAALFFMNHYYVNTEINGMDFSVKTPADVQDALAAQVDAYSLTVLEKDGLSDKITAEEIGLAYQRSDDVEQILKKQDPLLWPMSFLRKSTEEVELRTAYDEDLLEERMGSLQAFQVERVEPVSAYPRFDGEQFVIEPEKTGTEVNTDVLREKLAEYIREFRPQLDLEEEKCYVFPKYTSGSPEVKNACDEMNRYLQASITYTMDEDVVVDAALISQWVSIDEELNVTFHEEGVQQWLEAFGDRYDTVATTRSITTPTGKTVEVSGGTYGWGIDEETELEALIDSIKNGEVVRKEPAYYPNQTAASHGPQDWGDTYAEVDIEAQHMWLIKNGAVVLESDVVTGKPIPSMETTTGVFTILEKARNATLVGDIDPSTGQPSYRTPVSFWMRITWSGIGFHDANWQAAFGGTRYRDGWGSHGCVNMPWDKASELFDLIEVGMPVIIHN